MSIHIIIHLPALDVKSRHHIYLHDGPEFKESEHPRKSNGEFGMGGGPSGFKTSHPILSEGVKKAYIQANNLNGKLRANGKLSPEDRKNVKELDTAIEQSPLKEEKTFYRGVGAQGGLWANLSDKELVGKTFEDKGYSSSADEKGTAVNFAHRAAVTQAMKEITPENPRPKMKAFLFEITAPKGMKALNINPSEAEWVFSRGSKFKIEGVEDRIEESDVGAQVKVKVLKVSMEKGAKPPL